jgi:DNA-binding PadR family transcriptional regulator
MPDPHPRDPGDFLPLNPLEFRILLALRDDCLHGYAIVKDVERRAGDGEKIFPANLYRRIRNLAAAGLLAEAPPPDAEPADDRQRKFFRLTPLGLEVARAEALRLSDLLSEPRAKALLADIPPGTTS